MAEEEESKPAAPPPAPAKSKKKLFIAIAAILLVLVAVGVPATLFVMKKDPTTVEEAAPDSAHGEEEALVPEGHDDEEELDEDEAPLGAMTPFDPLLVNLSGGGYLRCQMHLEFTGRDIPKRYYARQIVVRDSIITLLTGKTIADLSTRAGKDMLKDEIKNLVNEILKHEEVSKIYFTQFVTQQ